jgi:calcineurin-like phosphoesterase family protein
VIFFTSDTHFWHKNVIAYCSRPYQSLEEMNQDLITRWNARVKPEDTVYHLGDVCFGPKEKLAPTIAPQRPQDSHPG